MSETVRRGAKRVWLGALVAATLALGVGAAPAYGGPEPLFNFFARDVKPGADFEGPCGLGVDSSANFYVSDYYHHAINVYSAFRSFQTQLANVDPLDGPCGLAIDSTGKLYVNDYHRDVVRYTPSSFPPGMTTTYGSALTIDSAHPTGVAVDAAGNVYVNDRTYIAVYGPTGAPVESGGSPLRIGLGSLGEGYGVAISGAPLTSGRIYVPDAANDTVKVYEPAVSQITPTATILGPPGGFNSLRDSAVAVDRARGEIYVADNLHPGIAERPEATIYTFSSGGGYQGHLKYNIVDALPPGLAIDNSFGANQGRVYVTTGNTDGASVYAYGPEPAVFTASVCAPGGACPVGGGVGGGSGSGSAGASLTTAVSSPATQVAVGADKDTETTARKAARHRKKRRVVRRHRHRRAHHKSHSHAKGRK